MNAQINRPDFSSLNGQALVDAYNQYVDKWRTSKFSSKADGVEACNKAFEKFAQKEGLEIVEQDIPDEFEQAQEDYARSKQVEAEVIQELEEKASGEANIEKEDAYKKECEHQFSIKMVDEMLVSDELKDRIKKLIDKEYKVPKAVATPRKSKNSDKIIKIKALRNPRREGSKAWHHFQVMNSGDVRTVSDYLNRFPADQRKNANQWLSNTIADGYVELVDEA